MRAQTEEIIVSGAQQTLAMFAGLVMVPLIIARGIGVSVADGAAMVTIAIFTASLTTWLQVRRFGWIGSGYLLVMGSSSMFIAPSLAAGKAGGLPLVFGMTLALGCVELLLAPLAGYVRRIVSPAVVGVMVALLAMSVIPVSMVQFAGGYGAGPKMGDWHFIVTGLVTLLGVLAAHYSGIRILRTGSVVFGVLCGYVVAVCFGQVSMADVSVAPWFGVPRFFWYGAPKFDWAYALPFALAYVMTTLETYGDIHAIAHVSGDDCATIDYRRIRGGLLTDGLGSMLAGAFGTTANTSFSGNIAIAEMSGVTSPLVGCVVSVLLMALSFMPKLSALIVTMPAGVLGGSMLIATAFLLAVAVRMLRKDVRTEEELLAVGIGLTMGLGAQMCPSWANGAPQWLRPLMESGICVGTLSAVVVDWVGRWGREVMKMRRGANE